MRHSILGATAFAAGAFAANQTAASSASKTAAPSTSNVSAYNADFSPPVPASAINPGLYSLTALPVECTASSAPYTTAFWVQSNQMNVEDDGGWWGSGAPVEWTFSTNTSDIMFGDPAFPGANGQDGLQLNPNVTARTQANSFTISMSEAEQGQQLFWQVWSDNGTAPNDTFWNSTSRQQQMSWETVTFYLSIEGSTNCPDPVGNTSCTENTIERTSDQWNAYGVDAWLESWIKNNSDAFATRPMMEVFQNQFNIGSGQVCSITGRCELISVCNELPNHGNDSDSAQIYLALIAMQNLSDMLNNVYEAVQISELETLTQIATIAMDYHNINNITNGPSQPPLAFGSSIVGIFSSVLSFIPGYQAAKTALSLTSSILTLANNRVAGASTTAPDPQYAQDQAAISEYLGQFVGALATSIEDSYSAVFTNGTNLTSILQGGAFVNRTDLNIDCADCLPKEQGWLEQYLGLKMINNMWWTQNVFITFMPYGNITQVDTVKPTTFTESDCASGFRSTPAEAELVVCSTDDYGWDGYLGPGMARLNWYWPQDPDTQMMNGNGYGILNMSHPAPGANITSNVLNTTGTNSYTFKPADVIESSLRGFIQGGFNYDGVENTAQSALNSSYDGNGPLAAQAVTSLFSINATSAGMFSIPVCIITDLNKWPTYWSSTPSREGGDSWCQCGNSEDRNGKKFSDYVPPPLQTISTNIIGVDGLQSCADSGPLT